MATGEWGHMTGAEGVVDSLRRAGVTRAFGIPSVESTELFHAFRSSSIEIILSTHEQCAAYMACAQARLTGVPGVCVLSSLPGLTNAFSGIAAARFESLPMLVVLASDKETEDQQLLAARHPIGAQGLAAVLCKAAFALTEAEEVPMVFARAIRLAQEGEPGPVLVEVPRAVQRLKARMEGTGFKPGPRVLGKDAEGRLQQICDLIAKARSVGIYAGAGCVSAMEELAELAEMLEAPVASTLSGLGVLPAVHPLWVGYGLGNEGSPLAQQVLDHCDLIIAVGCKFNERWIRHRILSQAITLAHIDVSPDVAGKNINASVAVVAPAKQALRFILDRVQAKKSPGLREMIRESKRALRKEMENRPQWPDAVDPVKFFFELRELLAGEDILILDSGHHAFFGVATYPVMAPRTLLMPVDYRSMGFAVPAAIAAKLAVPGARVVACVGDGGFQLTGFEMLTARRCNIAPVVVVFADGQLDYVRSHQERLLARETCVDLVPINYEDLARSFGISYACIRRDEELAPGLKKALTIDAPVLVELRVAYREAAAYLKFMVQSDMQQIPRSSALKLGVRLILRKILGRKDR